MEIRANSRMSLALLLSLTLSFSHLAQASAVSTPKCSTIATNPAIKKGISLPCLDGKGKFIFQAIRGPVLINVWGSWCEPCKQEIPFLVQIAKEKKIQIIGVDVEERNTDVAKAFVKENNMTWPQLYDVKSATRGIFGMGVPVTRFIDVDGKAVYEKIGPFKSAAEIRKAAKEFLGVKS